MKKILFISIFLLFLSQLNPAHTFALSCAEMPSIEEAYEKYDGVIIGQVDEVNRKKANDENNEIKLTVRKSFKEIDQLKLTVDENLTWGALSGPSEIGEEYLFFLKKKDTTWENPLCSPSIKVAKASAELEFLKDKEIALPNAPAGSTPYEMKAKEPSSNFPIKWTIIVVMISLIGISAYGLMRQRIKKMND